MIEYGKCPELDKVLRSIPGLKIGNSGPSYMEAMGNEGGKSINEFIDVRDQRLLFPLGRCLDRRYSGLPWTLTVNITDMEEDFVCYHLQSINLDEEALEDAKILARELEIFLKNHSVMNHFGLDKLFEEMKRLDILENREENIENILDN